MSGLKNLKKIFEPVFDDSVSISGNGVVHVDANRLLAQDSVKKQLEAARRLQRAATPSRKQKIA